MIRGHFPIVTLLVLMGGCATESTLPSFRQGRIPADRKESLALPSGYHGSAGFYLRSRNQPTPASPPKTTAQDVPQGGPYDQVSKDEPGASASTFPKTDQPASHPKTYEEALRSPNVQIRGEAYRQAAQERRREAVPFLMEEIRTRGSLAHQACAALGAIGDPAAVPTLREALVGQSWGAVVGSAASALGMLKAREARADIEHTLIHQSAYVRNAAAEALGALGDPKAVPALCARMNDSTEAEEIRFRAAAAAASLGDESAGAYLQRGFLHGTPRSRALALQGISDSGNSETTRFLAQGLADAEEEVWTMAADLYAERGAQFSVPLLRPILTSSSRDVSARAALVLAVLGDARAEPVVESLFASDHWTMRLHACSAVAQLGTARSAHFLTRALREDPVPLVRVAAAYAMARFKVDGVTNALYAAAGDPDEQVRLAAAAALAVLGGETIRRGEIETVHRDPDTGATYLSEPSPEKLRQRLLETHRKHLARFSVVSVGGGTKGAPEYAVLRAPDGEKYLCRLGDDVYAGWLVVAIGRLSGGAQPSSPQVIVRREGHSITLRGSSDR